MAKRKPLPSKEELNDMLWKDYMKSNHWVKFRKTLDTDDAVCEICGKQKWSFYKRGPQAGKRKSKPNCKFNTHHKHYNHLGYETRDDVLYLCCTCHSLFHDIEMASRTRRGIFTILYNLVLENTPWEYEPFKDRNKNK